MDLIQRQDKTLFLERDCEHCIHHTEKGCKRWNCEFEEQMTRAEVYQLAINTYGNKNQQAMMIEEMSELTKAISKYWRNPGEEEYTNVLEEMADVEIMLEQMKMMFGKTDEFVWHKTGRLAKRLKGETDESD